MAGSSLVYVGIAPHPPIMVPEVGGSAIEEVRASIDAMQELTERIIASGAETIVLISPHAPLAARAFVAYQGYKLRGSFAGFRAPGTEVEATLDEEFLSAISKMSLAEGFKIVPISGNDVDHGTSVPLYFLQRNGWRGRVVAFGYTFLSNEDHLRFGSCIRAAADAGGKPIALVASGDLSHRLKVNAPAGFSEDAHLFDSEVVAAINESTPELIASIEPQLRSLAGECGFRSMLIAIGASDGLPRDCEVLKELPHYNVGLDDPEFRNFAGIFSDRVFDRFHRFAAANLKHELPLLIAGGCGLNCDWNSKWRDSGLFSDVFVPPVANDSGSAIGTCLAIPWWGLA